MKKPVTACLLHVRQSTSARRHAVTDSALLVRLAGRRFAFGRVLIRRRLQAGLVFVRHRFALRRPALRDRKLVEIELTRDRVFLGVLCRSMMMMPTARLGAGGSKDECRDRNGREQYGFLTHEENPFLCFS